MNVNLFLSTTTGQEEDLFQGLFTDPVFWMALFVGVFLLITLSVVNNALNVMKEVSLKAQGRWKEAEEAEESPSALLQALTAAVPVSQEDEIMTDHDYDGIRELDNRLPPWWLWGFYASIVFAVVYIFRFHISESAPLSDEEYAIEVQMAEEAIAARQKASGGPTIDESNVTYLSDATSLAAGAEVYASRCIACHAEGAAGMTGPNLTDEYWINGGGIKNVFNTIKNGGRKGTAMIPWKTQLSAEKMQQVASYIISLQGTNPPNAKEAEGDLWVEEAPAEEPATDEITEETEEVSSEE